MSSPPPSPPPRPNLLSLLLDEQPLLCRERGCAYRACVQVRFGHAETSECYCYECFGRRYVAVEPLVSPTAQSLYVASRLPVYWFHFVAHSPCIEHWTPSVYLATRSLKEELEAEAPHKAALLSGADRMQARVARVHADYRRLPPADRESLRLLQAAAPGDVARNETEKRKLWNYVLRAEGVLKPLFLHVFGAHCEHHLHAGRDVCTVARALLSQLLMQTAERVAAAPSFEWRLEVLELLHALGDTARDEVRLLVRGETPERALDFLRAEPGGAAPFFGANEAAESGDAAFRLVQPPSPLPFLDLYACADLPALPELPGSVAFWSDLPEVPSPLPARRPFWTDFEPSSEPAPQPQEPQESQEPQEPQEPAWGQETQEPSCAPLPKKARPNARRPPKEVSVRVPASSQPVAVSTAAPCNARALPRIARMMALKGPGRWMCRGFGSEPAPADGAPTHMLSLFEFALVPVTDGGEDD